MGLLMKLPEGMKLANYNGIQLPVGVTTMKVDSFGINCYDKHEKNPSWRGKFLGFIKDAKGAKLLPGTVYPVSVVKMKTESGILIDIPIPVELVNVLKGDKQVSIVEKTYIKANETTETKFKIAEFCA